jgi:hypothetical protein
MKKLPNISKLITVAHYAKEMDVTTACIYKRIKEEKMQPFVIDGIQFIDISVYPITKNK